jgi:tyrosine phenol-lyase
VRDPELADQARQLVVVYEGMHTYGGMAGRDMEAIAQGIVESVDENNIAARIGQVEYLGGRLIEAGVPVVRPIGGHAIFLDAAAILNHLRREELPAQTLIATIYLIAGVRGVERGAVSAGRDPQTGQNRYPALELVRLAIPRRTYTQSHMDLVADGVIEVYKQRGQVLGGLRFDHEPKSMRFFQARFAPTAGQLFDTPTG